MASSLPSFQPPMIRASSSSSSRKPDANRRKATVSSNWWTPVFGWSSDPDYIGNTTSSGGPSQNPRAMPDPAEAESGRPPRSRFSAGCFTEDKAKQLRRKTLESSTFHDVMYHSAIASRLASDLSGVHSDK
ncbi:uncharacterized protein LOC125420996 [Ziziphus jujuba]|uniref:Uncharacterized protein LOC125420996 n=2 Tax=Ziziphus jujuba TaxID=326968 RepID=A0ABM3IAY1_ZIZJJ|nr:uncharacterized protein LOC125420996 [Ziziphus jujuba]KAH7547358.1 hypothetical protein FEM48_Zijuj01G0301300 [Ziziphus jujuba var. spinosa]